LQALWHGLRRRRGVLPEPGATRLTRGVALRRGALSTLGSRMLLLFFTSLLPQFASSVPALAALGLAFCSLTLLWLTGYAFAVARAGLLLRRGAIRRALTPLTRTAL